MSLTEASAWLKLVATPEPGTVDALLLALFSFTGLIDEDMICVLICMGHSLALNKLN